ncbi:MAG: flagellin lysine-N-methylase [Lachnospiraceae bacterium]|nr:flagellin lysine-N-methylase [Lachnospiraceae bacterium]
MKIKKISILKQFQCTGAACPSNCCRGWKIPIDDDAYKKYITEKGVFGFVLRSLLVKREELTSFRCSKRQYRCPFWGVDHLCSLQKNHGTDYMPRVCVEFPRQLSNFGTFCEETLYLACHEAARLFLEQARSGIPFTFAETTGEAGYGENTTNDDFDFLNYLLKSRDELIAMLTDGCGLSTSLLTYAKDTQEKCLSYGALNTGVNLGSEQFALPSPLDYAPSESCMPFTVNASMMHTLFFKGFYHPSLKHSSPVLYKLCQKYIREFYTLTKTNPAEADKKLNALLELTYDYVPDFDALMTSYYIYFLQKNFLDIFEDYCFVKHMLCGMAQTQMLKLFIALYCKDRRRKKNSDLPADELALIMAVYERRAPQIEDALKEITI